VQTIPWCNGHDRFHARNWFGSAPKRERRSDERLLIDTEGDRTMTAQTLARLEQDPAGAKKQLTGHQLPSMRAELAQRVAS
jgi:hypothetical protein